MDSATNRPPSSGGYDANGLPSAPGAWDVENRMVGAGGGLGTTWTYDPYGKRVRKAIFDADTGQGPPELYFYSVSGQKIAPLTSTWNGTQLSWSMTTNVYFGGKLVRSSGETMAADRLGSVRSSYYPYGQERTPTPDGREKFATYFRDGPGQDYADQRYYNQAGAFWSPDPGGISTAQPGDPTSWNRYAYVNGDPVNFHDPTGGNAAMVGAGYPCGPDWMTDASLAGPCDGGFAEGGGGADPCYSSGNSFSPAPNPACYVPILLLPIVSAEDPGPVPVKIKVTYDCFTTRIVGLGSVVERDITYEAYAVVNGRDVLVRGDTITEHLTLVSGTKPPESSGTTTFVDGIAVGSNGRPFEVTQTFTVTYQGQTYNNLPLYDANGNAVSNNTNDIKANAKSVSINGSTAAKNGSCN